MTSIFLLVIAFSEYLLSLGVASTIDISYPFKIHDLASMIEPFCNCRILGSEIESSNFYEPTAPCEVADLRQVIQETFNGLENVTLLYTKPRQFLNLKYTCVLNIYYIKDQVGLHNYFLYMPVYGENKTGNVQKTPLDIANFVRYLSYIWINMGNTNHLFKFQMRLQYTFVVVNQDKQIPPGFDHFTHLLTAALRGFNWFSAMIISPEEYYSQNSIENTVKNTTAILCVPQRTDNHAEGFYCETVSSLNLQIVVKLRNKNFTPSCVFMIDPKHQQMIRLAMDIIGKARSNQNKLFEFLALIREKKYKKISLFIEQAAKVDLWQQNNGMKQIDTFMAVEICAQLNYSADQNTFTEFDTFIIISPPTKYAEISETQDYLYGDMVDYGNSAGVQYEDYRALSCYRVPTLSFQIYTIPFHQNLWITLPVTLFIVLLTLKVYTKIPLRNAFSFCLFFYSSIVNNSTSIPETFSKSKILRLIWIPWILMCIIINNCYISILVSYINVPHSGEPFTNISQVLCKENDGIKSFDVFPGPFEITNETSSFSTLFRSKQEIGNHRITAGHSRRKEAKQNYNKAINFWKPTQQFALLHEYLNHNFMPSLTNEIKLVVHQYVRSGGTGYLEKLKKYHNDDSCFSLLSPPLNPGLDTFSASPHGYELLDVILSGLTDSEVDQEHFLAKFVQPKQRHYPKFPNMLQQPVETFTHEIYGIIGEPTTLLVKKYHPFVKEAAIEDELTECGKSVYISTAESVKDELNYLRANYPTLSFYTPNYSIFPMITGWTFPPIQMVLSKLPKRIQAYYAETGIYQHLNRQTRMASLINRRKYTSIINKAKKVSAIKLSKPLQTVFIIILVGLLTTLVVFGFELIICPNIPVYFLKCHHLFFLSLRVFRRSFVRKKNRFRVDLVRQYAGQKVLKLRDNTYVPKKFRLSTTQSPKV